MHISILIKYVFNFNSECNDDNEEKIVSTAFWLHQHIISNSDIIPTILHFNLSLEGHEELLLENVISYFIKTCCYKSMLLN